LIIGNGTADNVRRNAFIIAKNGKTGINVSNGLPEAMLHVKDSSVLFQGGSDVSVTPGNPPASGSGVRMMWYPDKASFRAGYVSSTQWDKDSIGNYSFASGANTRAKGIYSTAMGYYTKVTGDASTALGYFTNATGFASTALGNLTNATGDASTAMGFDTKATGDASTAMGSITSATGDFSTALGYNTNATGNYSTALGFATISRAYASVVLGRYNDSISTSNPTSWVDTDPVLIIGNGTADNVRRNAFIIAKNGKTGINVSNGLPEAMLHVKDSSVLFQGGSDVSVTPGNPPASGSGVRMMWYPDKAAFRAGYVNSTQWSKDNIGNYSFASGYNTKATGDASTALGNSTNATGNYSFASGYNTKATGNASTALGSSTNATGTNSTVLGIATNSRAHASVVLGRYNDSISTSEPTFWVDTDPVFMIGNGTANNTRSNAFIVAKNGETGINVANGMPQALLHLKAKEATYNMHIRLENVSNSDYASMVYDGDMKFRTFGVGDVYQWRNSTNNIRMTLDDLGNLTIAGIYSPSDARLKKNIIPLQNSLLKIIQLKGHHYNWIDKTSDASLQTGLLAQEVETQMPELVKTDEDGVKSVNYNGMIPYLVEAIKELKRENEVLKKEIDNLKGKLH
jgi:hypothetical protein